ncbi:MAG TPA: hypothetical protein VK772_17815 [Puia sp.]|nr:hypothetical protein [Puia sp.]
MKCLYGFVGIVFFIFFIFILATVNDHNSMIGFLLSVLALAGSVLIFVNLSRRSIVITGQTIIATSLFSRKQLDLDEIKGCRIEPKIIYIEPTSEDNPTIRIGNYIDFKNSEQLAAWCRQHFKDLNALDLEKEQNDAMNNPELGTSEQERTRTLKKSRNLAYTYVGLGLLLSFMMIFFQSGVGIALLIIYPVLGILVMATSRGTIKFLSNTKRSISKHIEIGLFMPGFLLLITSFVKFNIVESGQLMLRAIAVSAVLFLLLYKTGINRSMGAIPGQVFFMIVFVLIYGFGSIRQINCAFDHSKAEFYDAVVRGRRISRGRSTSYYLRLTPWGPVDNQEETEVRRNFYNKTEVGDTVQVNLKKGLLNIPWYFIQSKN